MTLMFTLYTLLSDTSVIQISEVIITLSPVVWKLGPLGLTQVLIAGLCCLLVSPSAHRANLQTIAQLYLVISNSDYFPPPGQTS